MVSYVHNIMKDNEQDTAECIDEYNAGLIYNAEQHKLCEDNEQDPIMNTNNNFNNATINQYELDKWKQEYEASSEKIFNETQDLSDDQETEELLDSISKDPNEDDNNQQII